MIVGDFWHESNRLFVQDNGKPIHPSTISKWFEQFVKKIGLPVINFHGLRHTKATLLISQQVDVQQYLQGLVMLKLLLHTISMFTH